MAAQQDQEERAAGDRGDRAHRTLAPREERPCRGVAEHQEGGTTEGRGGNQEAVIGAEDETQEVGNDEAHEADQPGCRDRGADHQRGRAEQDLLHPLHVDAELRRGLLAEGEQVESPGQGHGTGEPQCEEDPHPAGDLEAGVREVPDQPEEDAGPLHQTGHRGEEDDRRRGEGVEDDSGEEQRGRREPAGAAGDGEEQEDGQDGSGERGGRHRGVAAPEGATEGEDRDPAEGGAARDAEDVGIGEGVSEQSLEERARHRQGGADQRGERDPRQADAEHDVGARRLPAPGERAPHLADREPARADRETESDGEGEESAETQQHRSHPAPRQHLTSPAPPGPTSSGPWIAATMRGARSR
jgi:hypothetical protein